MLSEKAKKAMENLGLTGYEIKAYVTLLNEGALTAQELSNKSNVPYSKIYEVLDKLEEKGWIETDGSRPTKFYPKSPTTALEATRLRLENELKENESIVLNELKSLYEKTGVKEKPEIWVIRGVFNILARVKEIIENSREELLIAFPAAAEELAKPLQPLLRMLYEKGVKIYVLAAENTSKDIIKALSRVSEVRLKDSMFGGGVISDSKEVIILLAGDNNASEALAIWAEHIGLARFAKEYFQYLWQDAKE
ncbi:MAG: transcriptional regulator [Candidatus Nitrosocaldaceae archaeon]|nr:MAG: transcriptional regulator [Candidatus Nitrosocaldaceae archaeon]